MSNPTAGREPLEGRLDGHLLLIARAGWLLVALSSLGVCITALFLIYADPRTPAAALNMPDLESPTFAKFYIGINAVYAAVCVLVAAIIFWRRSDDWMALLTALMIVVFGTLSHNSQIPRILIVRYPDWQIVLQGLTWLISSGVFCWFYLFPNGRFVPRWTRWLALAFPVVSLLPNLVFRDTSPETIQLLAIGLLNLFLFGSLIAAQIYRYRHVSNTTERLQTKWVVYGVALLVGGIFTAIIADVLRESGHNIVISDYGLITVVYVATLLLPISIGVAILRYRLYNIDIIIRRTLIYSTLTLVLGLVYVGCILVSRILVAPLVGGSELSIVASTLAIAALFFPLRRRIQSIIDKRFYRRKYDAAKVLTLFSVTARDETDLEQLNAEMLRVVDETMQPEFIGLWLRDTTT